jgi:hypothetical protein
MCPEWKRTTVLAVTVANPLLVAAVARLA